MYMDDFGYIHHKIYATDELLKQLTRIADAQERLLLIAEQAQKERNELSDKMKQAFKVQGLSANETK